MRWKAWVAGIAAGAVVCALSGSARGEASSDPAHADLQTRKPLPWPGGVVPYDLSQLTADQQATVLKAMRRWTDTGARLRFIPRTTEAAYVYFTGRTDAGNNTTRVGFEPGARCDVNITAFWWRQGEWMPAHELGHVLGFFHEHARWDRDAYITVHYEHIKAGRQEDYDWVPKTNWLVNTLPYDYRSIMHYRTCWASNCEGECKDGDGASPCAVLDPKARQYHQVIGQWQDNRISDLDAARARAAYGAK